MRKEEAGHKQRKKELPLLVGGPKVEVLILLVVCTS